MWVVVHPLHGLNDLGLQVPWRPVAKGVEGLVPYDPLLVVQQLKYPLPELRNVGSDVARAEVLQGLLPFEGVGVKGPFQVVLDGFVTHDQAGVFAAQWVEPDLSYIAYCGLCSGAEVRAIYSEVACS